MTRQNKAINWLKRTINDLENIEMSERSLSNSALKVTIEELRGILSLMQ